MEQLYKAFEQLNIPAGRETFSKLEKYMELVLAKNEEVNLTAITEKSEFIRKHFIDSLICAAFQELKNAETVIDVGTGAGFPGVPLALVFPEKRFLLIDSLGKRIKILGEMLEAIGVSNAKPVHGRAEDLAHKREYRENFNVCVSRAVADLSVLSEYCLPFVKVGGSFISYKGPGIYGELKTAAQAIKILGGESVDVRNADIEGFGLDHNLAIIKKKRRTPHEYPRKAGTPGKNPLR